MLDKYMNSYMKYNYKHTYIYMYTAVYCMQCLLYTRKHAVLANIYKNIHFKRYSYVINCLPITHVNIHAHM